MLSMVDILNRCAEACDDCELVLEEPFVQDMDTFDQCGEVCL